MVRRDPGTLVERDVNGIVSVAEPTPFSGCIDENTSHGAGESCDEVLLILEIDFPIEIRDRFADQLGRTNRAGRTISLQIVSGEATEFVISDSIEFVRGAQGSAVLRGPRSTVESRKQTISGSSCLMRRKCR